MVAVVAVYTDRITLKKTPLWTDTLKHHTSFTKSQLMVPTNLFCDDSWDCVKILVTSHSIAPAKKLKIMYKKYSSEKLGEDALRPPATEICKYMWFYRICLRLPYSDIDYFLLLECKKCLKTLRQWTYLVTTHKSGYYLTSDVYY